MNRKQQPEGMSLAYLTPFDEKRLDMAQRLGLGTIQLRVGPGFPIDTSDSKLRDAKAAAKELRKRKIKVGSLGFYRNLLDPDASVRSDDRKHFENVLNMAEIFNTDLIGTFAGRDPELSIEENIQPWADVWGPLARKARKLNLRIAFENCTMFRGYPNRGINVSHTPHAYELMFKSLAAKNLGIEFDPSHLIKQMIDPVGFLRRFKGKVFHVHAKDHERLPQLMQLHGCYDVRVSRDRYPGRGEVDFWAIVNELREHKYLGPITIEAERDPDYQTPKEIEGGLAHSVRFLQILMAEKSESP